jgi:hypothetical protein
MRLDRIVLDHKQDVEWIIELWLRIHGGDPAPDGKVAHIDPTAAMLAVALSARLAEVHGTRPIKDEVLQKRLAHVGIAA